MAIWLAILGVTPEFPVALVNLSCYGQLMSAAATIENLLTTGWTATSIYSKFAHGKFILGRKSILGYLDERLPQEHWSTFEEHDHIPVAPAAAGQ